MKACLAHNFSILMEIIFKIFKKLFCPSLELMSRVQDEKSHALRGAILLDV